MSRANSEKGGVLVFMTFMIVLLLIMVGMGLDTGYLTYTRSQGQAAVDAAALSAVSGLPSAVGLPLDEATAVVSVRAAAFNSTNNYTGSVSNSNLIGASNITYVQYNETSGVITDLPSIAGANGVRVALEKTNPYTGTTSSTQMRTPAFMTPLMKLFGASASGSNDVNVSAIAVLKAIPGIPIAIMEKVCNGNSQVINVGLRQSSAGGDNSCWTTYTDNSSANAVRSLLQKNLTCSGLPAGSELVTIGTSLELDDNEQDSTYTEAKQLFMTDKPGQWWFVPVIPNSNNCKSTDTITQWAIIRPTHVDDSGSNKYIEVDLVCGQGQFRADANQCFTSRLMRDTRSGM
ncbi:MAG: pilus assembly protein TadG-related protein [Candidatus Binatia bacterium]